MIKCIWKNEIGKCQYGGGEYEAYDLSTTIFGLCASQNDCVGYECEKEESKIIPTSEPLMMSFPISGGDGMLDLISILNIAMDRFDHLDEKEMKSVVAWFSSRFGGGV